MGNPQSPSKYSRELDPMELVLDNRGIDDITTFFQHTWEDCVQNPYDLDNITIAAKKIIEHLYTSKTIAILVDCDADGFTSAAVLANYFEDARKTGLVGNCFTWNDNLPEFKFIHHEGKIHGLTDTAIMKDLRDLIKPALLIVPDASGTEEQYKALNDLGIDIVVLDHHDTKEYGNNKNVIVVNNQHSEKYRNKALSGVGVAWQTCRVMDDLLPVSIADDYLDLVAVGLVADVMDLRSKETRFLVREGLSQARVKNPLLQHCIFANDYRLSSGLTPTKVAFNIAPLFNAITRIGSIEEKDMLLRSLFSDANTKEVPSGNRNSKGEMVPLVVEAYRLITNAKSRQTRRQDKLQTLIDSVIMEEGLLENKVLIIAIGEGDFEEEHRGLAGLVCNKLQEYYQRPTIIVFQNEDGTFSGSCRAPDTIEAFAEFRKQCEASGLCRYALGHDQAFGISMTGINTYKLQEYFNEKYDGIDVEPSYFCDFIFNDGDSSIVDVIENLSQFESFWGQGIKEPVIALKDVLVGPGTLSLVGQSKGRPTLRINGKNGVVCIRFGSSKEEFDSLCIPYDGEEQFYKVTIVGTASINEYRGERTPQLMIKDYEVHGVGYDF
jgi:single-stranded-DNA-specific exonuclease